LLGEYSCDIADNQNGQNNVSLSAEANGYLIADAIKLELVEDNQPAPSGLFFIHNDHLGTPKWLTDTQGQVVWSLQPPPFGEIHEEIANGITLLNGFPGQYRDSETGLSYNYYRDYDPSIGRYIQSDPIGLEGGLNTYGYVGGNPLIYIDPLGLESAIPNPVDVAIGLGMIFLAAIGNEGAQDVFFGPSNESDVLKPLTAGLQPSPNPIDHERENEILGMDVSFMTCAEILQAIKDLRESIRWRKSDLNPEDGVVYLNHLGRIKTLRAKLEKLEQSYRKGCGPC
jgi:RHS repeat-associated protein